MNSHFGVCLFPTKSAYEGPRDVGLPAFEEHLNTISPEFGIPNTVGAIVSHIFPTSDGRLEFYPTPPRGHPFPGPRAATCIWEAKIAATFDKSRLLARAADEGMQ